MQDKTAWAGPWKLVRASGLGLDILSEVCDELVTIDKFATGIDMNSYNNVQFIQMEILRYTILRQTVLILSSAFRSSSI
ncbi:MAG: hypothetical protein U0T81_13210 [Saprospiraceae bacterium]